MTDVNTPSGAYTAIALNEVDDQAAAGGFGHAMQARFARQALGCETIGLSLQQIAPGEHVPFAHRHGRDEEVYVVLSGSGQALVDGAAVALTPMMALRVAPGAQRSFAAGDEGLDLLAFGAHTDGDAEILPDPWPSD